MVTKRIDEEQVFHIARAIQDVNARSKYLYQVCEEDSQLRKRVEHLLEVQESESEFLKSNNGQTNTLDHLPITAKPGQRIGRYKLLQEIGEGGFGTVFMAEQLEPRKTSSCVERSSSPAWIPKKLWRTLKPNARRWR